jgi:hypothetical protein
MAVRRSEGLRLRYHEQKSMTMTLNADVIELHCFRCRVRSTFDRILQSRPVFKCRGCGNTKEVEELGRQPLPPAPRPIPKPISRTEKIIMAEEKAERKFSKNPLQDLIVAAVDRQIDGIRSELDDLRKQIKDLGKGDGDRALRSEFRDQLETEIPDLVQRSLLQMLATPSASVRKPQRKAAGKKAAGDLPPVIEGKEHDHKKYCTRKCSARQP